MFHDFEWNFYAADAYTRVGACERATVCVSVCGWAELVSTVFKEHIDC